MPDAQKQFELLAAEFETLCGEVEICKNPERRFALVQRMKILMDDIFRLLCTSLNHENKQARLSNPKLSSHASAQS
jgi:hypothetical protein